MTGFKSGTKFDKLGMRGSDTCELEFDRCFVPSESFMMLHVFVDTELC